MQGFALVMAVTGGFVFLSYHFSFWAAFGTLYMAGMILVALVAFISRKQTLARMALVEEAESDLTS